MYEEVKDGINLGLDLQVNPASQHPSEKEGTGSW